MEATSTTEGAAGPMTKEQAEVAQDLITKRELFNGETDLLGSMGPVRWPLGNSSDDTGAGGPFIKLQASIPQVHMYAEKKLGDERLAQIFRTEKIVFSQTTGDVPNLATRQGIEFLTGARDFVTAVPGAVAKGIIFLNGLRTGDPMTTLRTAQAVNHVSSMSARQIANAVGKAIYKSSLVGVLGDMADRNYYGAGGSAAGLLLGGAPAAVGRVAFGSLKLGPAIGTNVLRTESGELRTIFANNVGGGANTVKPGSLIDFNTIDNVTPGFYRANPTQLRFTQSDASPFFSKGGTIDSLVNDLRAGRVTADQVGDPLQIVMHEGKPFSIDNRRLVGFNQAGVSDVPIQIMSLENPAVASRFFDRFDPIGGEGLKIVITPSSGRTAAQQLLQNHGLIKGVQLGGH